MTPVLPTPPLPPIVKTTRFVLAVIAHLHWFQSQGFILTEDEARALRFLTSGFALSAATRSSTGDTAAAARPTGGSSNCVRLRCFARTFTKEWRVLSAT